MRPWKIVFMLLSLAVSGTAMAGKEAAMQGKSTENAYFAGGCFWCMQPAFDATEGVMSTTVGYTGGTAETANYEAVSRGKTGHIEAIEVIYDADKVTYAQLLDIYWQNIDPTDGKGQFADRGGQYKPAIYVKNPAQRREAEASKQAIAKKFAPVPIAVAIEEAMPFYPAEEYHQRYYEKNAVHYKAYKEGSGRAGFLRRIWGK